MTLDSSLRPTNTSMWCWSAEWHTSRTWYVNTVHFPTAKSQNAIPCLKAVGLNPGTEIPWRLPHWPTATCINEGRTWRSSLSNRLYFVTCGLVLFSHYFRLQLWQAFHIRHRAPWSQAITTWEEVDYTAILRRYFIHWAYVRLKTSTNGDECVAIWKRL
jgi:hypothetical protein